MPCGGYFVDLTASSAYSAVFTIGITRPLTPASNQRFISTGSFHAGRAITFTLEPEKASICDTMVGKLFGECSESITTQSNSDPATRACRPSKMSNGAKKATMLSERRAKLIGNALEDALHMINAQIRFTNVRANKVLGRGRVKKIIIL